MKRAVTKSYFIISLLCIAVLASLVVIADNLTATETSETGEATGTPIAEPDPLPPAQAAIVQSLAPEGATVERESITIASKPLSTPMQAIKACKENDCTTTGYIAASSVIGTAGYTCTVTDDGKVYLTCDSIYDGNGDGVCTSGESCVQFGIVGNYITRRERNSQDTFVDYDTTYVMTRAEVSE